MRCTSANRFTYPRDIYPLRLVCVTKGSNGHTTVSWHFVGVSDAASNAMLQMLQANETAAAALVQQRYEALVPGTSTTIMRDPNTNRFFSVVGGFEKDCLVSLLRSN